MKIATGFLALLTLLICVPSLTYSQDSLATQIAAKPVQASHMIVAGLQAPLNYTAGYRYQFSQRISAQVQGGLTAAPFDRYALKLLEGFGLDPTLSRLIDRSFRRGSSASLGVTLHAASPWYGTLFGQYAHFSAGPITPADGLGVYFKQDFSGFGLLDSPSFVFDLQSTLWIAGLRVGRSFQFNDSPFGLNAELSLGKVMATQNTFSSNRSLVDGLGLTQRLYTSLSNEIDTKLRQHGFLPTLNVLITYQIR